MRIAYFDCFAGVSGDMILGALVDIGLPVAFLEETVARLRLNTVHFEARQVQKYALTGTQVIVTAPPETHHRHLADIEALIEHASLPDPVRSQALAVFRRLAEAERQVHGVPLEKVHFHEVGALDAIVDVVGAVAGLHYLGVEQVYASPLPLGRGMIRVAHGPIPLPGPAVTALLGDVPVRGVDFEAETVTPTGAALLVTLTEQFGAIPEMTLRATGYGAGQRDLPIPNLLRLLLGDAPVPPPVYHTETLSLIEANLDDMNPEWYGPLLNDCLAAGALDAWLTPVQMKKGRPGILVSILTQPTEVDRLVALLLRDTTTLGVRLQEVKRHCLPRRQTTVQTPYGPVQVKWGEWSSGQWKAAPEHEDCLRLAKAAGVSVREVYQAALAAALDEESSSELDKSTHVG
ncbi:MAG TPA: nickel pincer cofactor biosynthesis protein LarC [Anaerolineae bacterium]|nr:nickel pincer cofactor biosynthesis protein LarC [Anaerolineae bacterium]